MVTAKKGRGFWFIGGFAVLMVVLIWLDWPISQAIFNPVSGFGHFFEAFGEVPCMLVASFGCAGLWATRNRKNKALDVIGFIGFGALCVLFGLGAGSLPGQYIAAKGEILYAAGILVAVAFMLAAAKIGKGNKEALRNAALVGLFMVLIALFGVNILKMIWGRPRMRLLAQGEGQFAFWVIPQPFAKNNEYMSFPSGHSANSACILWITLLPTFVKGLQGKGAKAALNMFAVAWLVLVMVSRVVMGAHFASDVLFGAGITVLSFTLLSRRFIGRTRLRENAAAI